MGSWGLKRDEQFALTNATTTCPPTDDWSAVSDKDGAGL